MNLPQRHWVRALLLSMVVMGAAFLLSSCHSPTPAPVEDDQNQAENPPEPADPLRKQIEQMTLTEKIGQMVIAGIDGTELNDRTIELIEAYKLGGIILYKPNIAATEQTVNLINDLKNKNAAKGGIPLFISVDEEGGRVSRLPEEFVKIPDMGTIGQTADEQYAYEIGRLIGKRLQAFGINMDFAPVLDINSNPQNPVIGDRSFGSDADLVSKMGVKLMGGLQSQNIISVVKHFPGHGDTSVDSHIGLPKLDHSLERLRGFELLPFGQAIEQHADAVMVAHILLSDIDPELPASLSPKIITDLLRVELKFEGVVITDDLTMGAIVENYKLERAAVLSVAAGTDIVLVAHGFEQVKDVVGALEQAVLQKELNEEAIDESVYRILQLKQRYQLEDKPVESVDAEQLNQEAQRVLR